MFLFILLAAYLIMRGFEDVTATVRKQPPPRHEYRMAKLAAREKAGTASGSSAGRYLTGLLDDAWDSAHHRRQLMAEARELKRRNKAKRKAKKIADREAVKNAEAGLGPDSTSTDAVGFDATAPEAADLSAVPEPGTTGAGAPAAAPAAPAPAPARPEVGAGEGRAPIGFDVAAPEAAAVPIVHASDRYRPGADGVRAVGAATRALATDLTTRAGQCAAAVDLAGAASEALYPLTAAQQATSDAVRGAIATGELTRIPVSEMLALPVSERADLLDSVRRTPGAAVTCVPGYEDVEALALLNERYGGGIDPADIYTHPDDAPPHVQALVARDRELIAEARAAAAARGGVIELPPGEGLPSEVAEDEAWAENERRDAAAAAAEAAAGTTESHPADDPEVKEENTDTPDLPDNVIPFKRTTTTTRMELPMTTPTSGSGEITGLNSAIAYAGDLSGYCTHTHDQIGAVLPKGEEAVASCEQALANLSAGGVQGQALTDVANVQEEMTGAIAELQAALARLEAAGASAASLKAELESHLQVQESYAATGGNAGNKEFVTAE